MDGKRRTDLFMEVLLLVVILFQQGTWEHWRALVMVFVAIYQLLGKVL